MILPHEPASPFKEAGNTQLNKNLVVTGTKRKIKGDVLARPRAVEVEDNVSGEGRGLAEEVRLTLVRC